MPEDLSPESQASRPSQEGNAQSVDQMETQTPFDSLPVFIHSLFRSGSSYFLETFRRSTMRYWCYYEPFHEILHVVSDNPEALLDFDQEAKNRLRHPTTPDSHFREYYVLRDKLRNYFCKDFSYDTFFGADAEETERISRYLKALLNHAQGLPVLECCRSFGRVQFLRDLIGGTHIFLWRNPRDQWWSYKISTGFRESCLLILNARKVPGIFKRIRADIGFEEYHDACIYSEFRRFADFPLTSEKSYLLFYGIWAYALLENIQLSDVVISIDSLSNSEQYRHQVVSDLKSRGIDQLDFSDCKIPQASYSSNEEDFFRAIESQVHAMLLQTGYGQSELSRMLELVSRHLPTATGTLRSEDAFERLTDDVLRARSVVIRYEDEIAELCEEKSAWREDLIALSDGIAKLQEEFQLRGQLIHEVENQKALQEIISGSQGHLLADASRMTSLEPVLEARSKIIELGTDRNTGSDQVSLALEAFHLLQQQLIEAEEGREQSVARADSLEKTVEGLREDALAAQERTTHLEKNLNELREQVQFREFKFTLLQQQLIEAEEGRDQGVARADSLEKTVEGLQEDALAAKERIAHLENQFNQALIETQLVRAERDSVKEELAGVYACRSWRWARPLRMINSGLRKGLSAGRRLLLLSTAIPGRLSKKILSDGLMYLQRHRKKNDYVQKILSRFPRLNHRLRSFAQANSPEPPPFLDPTANAFAALKEHSDIDLDQYPPEVLRIFEHIRRACQTELR